MRGHIVHWLRRGHRLSTYALLTLCVMVVVILWGAFVRISGSGNGCGDHWPLCNNEIFPHHPALTTVIEFTHRAQSGVVTFLVLGLVLWTFVAKPRRDKARKAAVFSGVLLLTEALLGAVLVLCHFTENDTRALRAVMQCVHFTNTMLLTACLTLTWWWSRERSQPSPVVAAGHAGPVVWIALLTTVFTGATGSVAALADTLFPSPTLAAALAADLSSTAPLLVRMRWMHPVAALIALACALWMSRMLRSRLGSLLLVLIAAQFVLGGLDVLLLAPAWLQIAHLLGADVYWIALVCAGATLSASAQELTQPQHTAV